MEGDLDPVVPPRERLVDRIVDHLVDEMVEPPEPGRADVHARPQPDRLEALEDSDVLCVIGRLGHEKSPANPRIAGTPKYIRPDGRRRRGRVRVRQLLRPLCGGLGRLSPRSAPRPSCAAPPSGRRPLWWSPVRPPAEVPEPVMGRTSLPRPQAF